MTKAADIAKAEKGHRAGNGWLVKCPVHEDKNHSCSITDGDRGLLLKCHAGCSQLALVDAARERGWLGDNPREHFGISNRAHVHVLPPNGGTGDHTKLALQLWREARSPKGTVVEQYLASRRLSVSSEVLQADALRFHPTCPYKLDDGSTVRSPSMLALMRNIRSDEPCAIHRTALKVDGTGKAELPGLGNPKKMLGPAAGAVVKLTRDQDITSGLSIVEGIETALSAACAGWLPVWACGSAGAIERFPVVAGIEALTVFADNDVSGVGYRTARECALRWQRAGCEATILLPRISGADLNDLVRNVP
jgi:hypothetical protein